MLIHHMLVTLYTVWPAVANAKRAFTIKVNRSSEAIREQEQKRLPSTECPW